MKETVYIDNDISIAEQKTAIERQFNPRGSWGKRRLNRFKKINGKLYQLHATKGWKPA